MPPAAKSRNNIEIAYDLSQLFKVNNNFFSTVSHNNYIIYYTSFVVVVHIMSLPRFCDKALPSSDDDVWLFGYGSLINKESRAITGMSGEYVFGYLRGVKRGWQQAVKWSRPSTNYFYKMEK